jgi:HlyD family secretion protein
MKNSHIHSLRFHAAGLALGWALTLYFVQSHHATAAEEGKPETPATHKVARGTLQTKVQLDGVFESAEMRPVLIDPKAWADLSVLEAVSHGSAVKQGQVLVRLDTEKIEEQIKDSEQARVTSQLALDLAMAELDNLKQTTPLKMTAAQRGKRRADEDFVYFEETDRAQKEKATTFSIKSAEERLDNAREELAQLEKMYKADDLTEETEEIILKRQKFVVESSEYFLETSKLSAERNLNTNIPREYENLRAQKSDQDLALQLAEQTLPNALRQKELALAKMRRDRKKDDDKLADLKADLERMTIRAPMDGLVYYGACENGRWTTGAVVAKKLIPGAKLAAKEIIMTIVAPNKLRIQTTAAEKDLAKLGVGLEGTAEPVSNPDQKFPAKLEELTYIPQPGGGFPATLSVKAAPDARLMPGMNCKISFDKETKSRGVLTPKGAVFAEGEQRFVYVWQDQDKPMKRSVKIGDSDDKMIDVVEGLEEGQKILLQKPE